MLNFKSKKSFGQIEPYVPDDVAQVEPVIEKANNRKDGIYIGFENIVDERDRYNSPSWFSTAVGVAIALAAILIGLWVLSAVMSQMPQLTSSSSWMP